MPTPSQAIRFLVALAVAVMALATPALSNPLPVEDYAPYERQTVCRTTALPGTTVLARWINRSFRGGAARATVRTCTSGGASEHKDGRAIDWSMSATSRRDRRTVSTFLRRLTASDLEGNPDAMSRRMGIMYVIWNDRIYSAWREFEPEPYLNSGCPSLSRCSPTLRHRDHVHVSLGQAGGRGETSWYVGRLP